MELTSPEQIPIQERRRQYNAIHRKMENGRNLPPGLAEKWANAKSSQDKFLDFIVQAVRSMFHHPNIFEHYKRILL